MRNYLAVFVCAMAMTGAPGCALFDISSTPAERYVDVQDLFTLAARAAMAARAEGKISDSDWETVYLPAINRGSEALDAANDARIAGDLDGLATARIIVEQALAEIGGAQ